MIGEAIGNFRIVARIGGGGMGDVFLAEQAALETKAAIKLLRPEISRDKEHVSRFLNEARAVGKIKHAGTVKIFDGGFLPSGQAYLVMELLEGETLAARIQRAQRLQLGAICDVGRQIASVLGATHAVGITHRDLKPDNIFIVPDAELASGERVKILDFGIAKLSTSTLATRPQTMGTMGTPAYMAPEQWGNSANVDARADAYSLGCVLFEMAGGRPPFVGQSFADLCAMHLTMPPPTLGSIAGGMPPRFEQLVARLLAKRPEERPSMIEVGRELDALGRDAPRPLDATLPPGTHHATPPSTTLGGSAAQLQSGAPKRTRGAVIAIGAVAVLGAGIVAIVLAARGGGETPKPAAARDAAIATKPPDAAAIVVVATPDAAVAVDWREQVAQLNAFVDVHGVTIHEHQVTTGELRAYVDANRDANVVPLHKGADDAPAAWMTFERARAYCRALGADLPTLAQWKQAAAAAWGISDGRGGIGPLQEWTSTVDGGLATVAGGAASMTAAERAEALKDPTLKQTEAGAGAGAKDVVIAGERIGFRCAKGDGGEQHPRAPAAPHADAPNDVAAKKARARALFDEAIAAYNRKDYREAAQKYDEAYALTPGPGLLSNRMTTREAAGDHAIARRLAQQYLDTYPQGPRAAAAKHILDH